MSLPVQPKIYHIVHVDRLASIIEWGGLLCDAEMMKHTDRGTTIGMSTIKFRRLNELTLNSHPTLYVGGCVPFYFCPRSVMLYLISRSNNSELLYRGGQEPIVHLEFDFYAAVRWAEANNRRWAFTLSNAGAYGFEDRCDLTQLPALNWDAIQAKRWGGQGVDSAIRGGKQAEFLVESDFPWTLVDRIGVCNQETYIEVGKALRGSCHTPNLKIEPSWYY